jgi:signal peptidase I
VVRVAEAAGKLSSFVSTLLSRSNLKAALDWLREPVLVFAVVYAIAAAVVQPFYVPSGSMQPTLGIGDLFLATKFSYGLNRYSLPFFGGASPGIRLFGRTPKPGDVVVFRGPDRNGTPLVKRGLPGDRIQMRNGRVWINGSELRLEPAGMGRVEDGPGETAPGNYFEADRFVETLPNGRKHLIFKKLLNAPYDDTGVYVVPPEHIFVMGDNRDDSADSRIPADEGGVGYLPISNLMGQAQVVVASVDFVNARGIWEWPFRLRWSRMLKRIH